MGAPPSQVGLWPAKPDAAAGFYEEKSAGISPKKTMQRLSLSDGTQKKKKKKKGSEHLKRLKIRLKMTSSSDFKRLSNLSSAFNHRALGTNVPVK